MMDNTTKYKIEALSKSHDFRYVKLIEAISDKKSQKIDDLSSINHIKQILFDIEAIRTEIDQITKPKSKNIFTELKEKFIKRLELQQGLFI
jgi:hypothetical protein